MQVLRAYKTEMDPTPEQARQLRLCGVASRLIYNWGLRRRRDYYKNEGKGIGGLALKMEFDANTPEDLKWTAVTGSCVKEFAFQDLDSACAGFFRRLKEGVKDLEFPEFEKPSPNACHFRTMSSICIHDLGIKLSGFGESIKLKENGHIPADRKTRLAAIRQTHGRWFVSVLVQEEIEERQAVQPAVGVDLGVASAPVSSDCSNYDYQNVIDKLQKKKSRLQRDAARKVKGSQNHKKALERVSKVEFQIAGILTHTQHQATSELVYGKDPRCTGIEAYTVQAIAT